MQTQKPSKTIAVGKAAQLWKLYGFASPEELVLEDLALALGVVVIEAPLERADARLIRRGRQGLVRINSGIREPGRKRFALAHELGHWVVHTEANQVAACTEQHMWDQYKGSSAEIEANYFASELLMPEHLLKPRIKGQRPSVRLLSELANAFNTSLTAMAMRYVDILDDYCAVVFSENGKIRWWRGSEDFTERFWIEAGSLLSRESVASAASRGVPVPPGPQEVESEAWVECRQGYEHETLLEEVLFLSSYNQVLSLLYLE